MPTLTAARGESKKREASANVDFSTIWNIHGGGLLQDEGKGVYRYTGDSTSEKDGVGQIRTLQPLDPYNGPSNVEITILDTGERNSIGIGVCNKAYSIDIMPGVNEGSIAICTEEAAILHFPHEPQPLEFNCRRGCVIKCAIVPDPMDDTRIVVEFYKDGARVRAISIHAPEGGLYGLVGLMSQGERVLISPPVACRRLDFSQVWEVCTPHIIQHHRGGLCSYVGPGYLNEESIGTVRTKQKMDPLGPLDSRSFEIRIVNPGEKMYIAIGVCNRAYPHNMLPGWKEISVGYHADNGFLFYNSDSGQPTNHSCREGDIIRCTVQPMDGSLKQVSVLFHCNGHLVEKLTAWTPDDGFYGSFGMMSKHECIHVALPEISEPYTLPKASFLSIWEPVTTNLQYNDNGIFEYTGAGGPDSIGTVRSRVPLNPLSTSNSFDVKIIHPGDSCYIAVGVCNPNYPPTQLPGWTENSVGFHADNGLILNGIGDEQIETRCSCSIGDVIRCTLEPVDGSNKQLNVIFHRNNTLVGKILLWNSRQGFYAQVGSMSKGEVIQIASPQTVPSSLTHDAHSRSMSVPVTHITKDAIKRKQLSTQDYSRMTPAVSNKEPFSEHHNIPHAHTMPVFPTASHSAEYPHGMKSTQETSLQHPMLSQPQWQHTPSETFPHNQQQTFSLTQSGRNIPQHHHVPFEQALTASPFPLQPATGHPLASESVTHQSPISFHDTKHNPFYASQVSVASAASDSDQHYWSQENQRDVKLRTASVSHVHSARPTETPKRYRTHTEPVIQKPTPYRGAYPPLVTKLEPDQNLSQATSTDSLKVGVTQKRTHQAQSVKSGFDYTDSTNGEPLPNAKKEVVLESVHEPVKEIEVCSSAPAQSLLFTKKENSLFRILHNVICNEDGTLQCTLPVDTHETSFLMRRLQLTEKMPYFEVELIECKANQNIVIGLVPQNHPHTSHIGTVPHTIGYHTATGSLVVSNQENRGISKPCSVGDVIGCRVEWSYKLEVCDPDKKSFVKVEWYRNGCSITEQIVSITPSGFYPALEMTSGGTVVAIRHSINLKPESYFASHPLSDNYSNIDIPSPAAEKWNCIQNAQIDENDFVMFKDQDKISSQSTIVQSQTPFTTVNPYFEIELQYPIGSYVILSVGGLEKISSNKPDIPGEAPNSIALFPLLGFIMCNGSVSTTLPQSIETEIKNSSEKLKVGVGVDFHQSIPQYSAATTRVTIYFTLNCQLINSTYVTFPSTGLFPTVAIGSDFRKVGERLLQLQFSHSRPQQNNLPLGFARAPPNAFRRMKSGTFIEENVFPEGKDTPQALQAALPLSQAHSYFEMKIMCCHVSHVFSCGVAPNTFSLTSHPGDSEDSIGFYPNEGSIHHSGAVTVVCPPCNYTNARIGCGARFPNEGSSKYMEVFFTLDGSMIAQGLVANCEPGLFPTIGFYTKGNGRVSIDLYAEDPYPDLQYKTTWRELSNFTAEGPILQTTSSDSSIAQLVQSVQLNKSVYFTIRPLIAMDCRLVIGFTNCTTCPLFECRSTSDADKKEIFSLPQGWDSCIVDMATGEALIEGKLYSMEQSKLDKTQKYGCGIEPIQNSSYHLFFFTRNDQVVFCRRLNLTANLLFPTIFAIGQNARLYVDACATWPLLTPIGRGWGRVHHLVLKNSKIQHTATEQRAKIPVGFAQASMPIICSWSYFEVEVCSRSENKAIAVGLASRTYPSNTWVGWKTNSVAYHLDDGNLFTGSGMHSHKIGPKIYQGHTVGCGVNMKSGESETGEGTKVEVFFTVNGAVVVEQKIAVPSGGFYPTICLESPTESVIFQRYPHFSSVCDLMGSEWGNCYSVQKVGMVVEHSCKHKEYMSSKGFPRGFCQASQPFSPSSSYFEVSIAENTNPSMIHAGIAVEIPIGYRSVNIDSVLYSGNGQAQMRLGGYKSTSRTEKFGIGDVIGCRLVYTDSQPTAVEFYLNKMKLTAVSLDKWKESRLFPTIILLQPGNSVIPRLNLPPPQWDPSCLVGWLRTERVHVRGNIAGYHSLNDVKNEVGLCQVSQFLDKNLNSSFEVEILDCGKSGLISVGVASTNYPALHQPGWKENSVAYHGDDGNLFNNNPYGVSFGPSWKERDIIGVGVRPPGFECSEKHEAQVYFTRNGLELGHVTIGIPPSGLFPTVGFHSPGERVKIILNPSPNGLGNFNAQLLKWKDMCSIQLQSTSQENQCILQYHDNGRKMPFTGIRLAVAIYGEPFSEKLQYVELDILSMKPSSAVAIGAVPKQYSLDNAPGWGKESLGYHSDNGQLYQGRGRGKYFGPIARKGDSIGCGINFVPNNQRKCSIYFTYNGIEIGRVRTTIPETGFYPCVCLTQKYDKVRMTISETFKPKLLIPELHMVGLMRISNCSYSDQIVHYSGNTTHSSGVAQFAVPMHKDRNYFAAHILKADDTILIGLAVRDYPLKYPPGSMSISIAYDITKGSIKAVYDSENFHNFTDPELLCIAGDRVGCGVMSSDSKSEPSFVYFTRNRVIVKKIHLADLFEDLYPVVGFVAEKKSSLLFMDWNMPIFNSPNLLHDC